MKDNRFYVMKVELATGKMARHAVEYGTTGCFDFPSPGDRVKAVCGRTFRCDSTETFDFDAYYHADPDEHPWNRPFVCSNCTDTHKWRLYRFEMDRLLEQPMFCYYKDEITRGLLDGTAIFNTGLKTAQLRSWVKLIPNGLLVRCEPSEPDAYPMFLCERADGLRPSWRIILNENGQYQAVQHTDDDFVRKSVGRKDPFYYMLRHQPTLNSADKQLLEHALGMGLRDEGLNCE